MFAFGFVGFTHSKPDFVADLVFLMAMLGVVDTFLFSGNHVHCEKSIFAKVFSHKTELYNLLGNASKICYLLKWSGDLKSE
jgi:hypothetical protein